MGFLKSIFGAIDKKVLCKLIEDKAERMVENEEKPQREAEYLAICMVLDDLASNSDRQKHKLVVDMVKEEYPQHYVDVMTYLAIKSGKITLQPEVEEVFMHRHCPQ